jgi:hypothetical protein
MSVSIRTLRQRLIGRTLAEEIGFVSSGRSSHMRNPPLWSRFGQSPGFADIAIAAAARHCDLTILSRNERHFAPMDVVVVDPFQQLPSGKYATYSKPLKSRKTRLERRNESNYPGRPTITSVRQIDANRHNARKSTSPITAEGKRVLQEFYVRVPPAGPR